MAISAALAEVLAAGRPQFNARVAETRHRYPAFDTGAFAAFLSGDVDAVVRAVAAAAPERTASATVALFDMALELVAQALAGPGARADLVGEVWRGLAPRCASLIAHSPVETLGALTNAVLHIARVPDARPAQWLGDMHGLIAHADSVERLRALGQIAAWRAGLAHFREGALAAADTLPEAAAIAAVGAPAKAHWPAIRVALHADPWWTPDAGAQRSDLRFGRFTGFGGPFAQPPLVRACEQGFHVCSGERYGLLIVDACGATLHPATAEDFARAEPESPDAPRLDGAILRHGERAIDTGLPANGLMMACNAHTVAVASPYTHAIALWPRRLA